MELRPTWRCFILLTFEKLMYQQGAGSGLKLAAIRRAYRRLTD